MNTISSRRHVIDIATRFQPALLVQVAEASGLAEILHQGPVSVESVAVQLGWELNRTRHFLDALCSLGFASSPSKHSYRSTATGSMLTKHCLSTAAPMVRHEHMQQLLWSDLQAVLATDEVHAQQQDRTMLDDEGRLTTLLEAMLAIDRELPSRIAARAGWDRVSRIADIAGGHGAVLGNIARLHSHITGVVLDQPPAAQVTQQTFSSLGVSDRCGFVVTDLRSATPIPDDLNIDCVLAIRCLHNFDRSTIRRIIDTSRGLLDPGGVLIVVDVRLDWIDGFAVPASAAVFGGYLAVNCAGGWLPPVGWWENELSHLGGAYVSERYGAYDLHEVKW